MTGHSRKAGMIRAQPMDAVVLVGGCDKTVPAQLMGAASADIPAIQLVTGPMTTGRHRGEIPGERLERGSSWVDRDVIKPCPHPLHTQGGIVALYELSRRRSATPVPDRRAQRGHAWLHETFITRADEGCDFTFLRRNGVQDHLA